MDSTCLNNTGFIKPAYVVKLWSQDDFDGFNGRQLCALQSVMLTMTNWYDLIQPQTPNWNVSMRPMC